MERSARRRTKDAAKTALTLLHQAALRVGVIVLPKHYYVPIADIGHLKRNRHLWAKRSSLVGLAVGLEAQVENLRRVVKPFQAEYLGNAAYERAVAGQAGPGYGFIEAQALHGVIRSQKPKRVIEVGSGVSSFCILAAIRKNSEEGHAGVLTCIEPHPSAALKRSHVELLDHPVEQLDPAYFTQLEAGDLLFIDSSHTVKVAGDVPYLYLEVLPRLNPGVWIHIHDIYLPYDYQRNAHRVLFQWCETILLHALLIGNGKLEIVFCLSWLHYDAQDILREVFPEYRPQRDSDGLASDDYPLAGGVDEHFPSSIFLRVGNGEGARA